MGPYIWTIALIIKRDYIFVCIFLHVLFFTVLPGKHNGIYIFYHASFFNEKKCIW
jgi:hypothetical protein